MSTNGDRDVVVDADGHVCEPPDLWERGLPERLRDQGIRLRWNEATGYDECLVEDRVATDRGLVGLGNAGETFDEFGRGRHYEDLNPAGFDAAERVKVLDSEGIDLSVIYPGLGLKLGGIIDPNLAVWSCRVYNDWIAEWTASAPDRLRGVGALPMQDPAAAAVEARRIQDLGLVGGFARPNAYLDRFVTFQHFFVRKVMLVKYSYAFVVLPGGFGTMDELFEAATLIQTHKILSFPVVLMDRAYWQPLTVLLEEMVRAGTIEPEDMKLLLLTDSPDEAMEHIRQYAIEKYHLEKPRPRASAVLGEKG